MRSTRSFLAFALAIAIVACSAGDAADLEPDPGDVVDPPEAGWSTLAPVPEARTEVSVTQIDDRVYVLGGFGPPEEAGGDASAPRTLWIYDTGEDRWESAGEIPAGTNHAGLVALNGRLYIVGGYAEATFDPTSQVHIFDTTTGQWSTGSPMPTPRGALAYAVLDGRIHTFGGTVADKDTLDAAEHNTASPDGSVGTHEVYDPEQDSWERLPPMPTARNHHAAETVDGAIVVSAGRAGSDMTMTATEIWDPESQSWREGAPLPTGRSGVAAAALDGWFYLFGGETSGSGSSGEGTFDEAERYNVEEDRWEELEPMPTPRHGLGAAAVADAIYVVSGGPQAGYSFGTANERYIP